MRPLAQRSRERFWPLGSRRASIPPTRAARDLPAALLLRATRESLASTSGTAEDPHTAPGGILLTGSSTRAYETDRSLDCCLSEREPSSRPGVSGCGLWGWGSLRGCPG